MSTSKQNCLFCNLALSGNRSVEHVLPQWLLKYLEIQNEKITPTHFEGYTGKPLSVRIHTLKQLIAGNVCRTCNSGWMSRIEVEVKDILIPLIEGTEVVVDLSANQRLMLARWTAKTVYMLNYASNFPTHVPVEHLHYLYAHPESLPERVAVFAQQHHGKSKFYWLQGNVWNVNNLPENAVRKDIKYQVTNEFYKISLQLGKLLLLVAYRPDDSWLFNIWSGLHVPLWPHKGKIAWYDLEPERFSWNNSQQALENFHIGLQVVHLDAA